MPLPAKIDTRGYLRLFMKHGEGKMIVPSVADLALLWESMLWVCIDHHFKACKAV
jgi:hypothetical protein